jgi:hypothetical protein
MTYWEWFTLITGAATAISLAIGISSWIASKTFSTTMAAMMRRMHGET